jgi:hypothetical protein
MEKKFYDIANSPALLLKHLCDTEREFDKLKPNDEHVIQKYARPIVKLITEIRQKRKMVIRIIQVQHEQINKYRKSIRDGRKIVVRGTPASLESVTMETMVQMTLRVIQDMKDTIPNLIQPLVTWIYKALCKLQKHMQLLKQLAESLAESESRTASGPSAAIGGGLVEY